MSLWAGGRTGESTGLIQRECEQTSKDLSATERQDSAVFIFSNGVNSLDICCFCESGEGECADQEIPSLVLSLKSLILLLVMSVPLNIAIMVLFLNNTSIFCVDQLFP